MRVRSPRQPAISTSQARWRSLSVVSPTAARGQRFDRFVKGGGCGFHHAIGVEHDEVAALQVDRVRRVDRSRVGPQRRPGCILQWAAPSAGDAHWAKVAGAGPSESGSCGVDHGIERGRERVLVAFEKGEAVEAAEQGGGIGVVEGASPGRVAEQRHAGGGGQSMAGDVADADEDSTAGKGPAVEPVPTDIAGLDVDGR